MQSAKEKLSNMASAAKEKADIYKAKIEEKAEKATAITEEEKVIAHERRKVKEAKAKMELHEDKAQHAAEKLNTKHSHLYGHHEPHLMGTHRSQPGQHVPVVGTQGQQQPVGTAVPMVGATAPTYPLGGHPPPMNKRM
ncbi:Seed maturation protein [Quillaja saponaria]|uniref:Seed maturation protein n=1 Tax=Quillaja saponaria TaxID=32244 RepID=A0AAD7L6W4_QUISA|nr:Seed maturation protein [Quillaja saponaria]